MMNYKTCAVFGAVALSAATAMAQPAVTPVTVNAPDGTTLKATYYSPGTPGPGIMLFHQCNSERGAWGPFAKMAAARGYHVLALDFRGYGESGGQRFESFQEQQPVIEEKWPGDADAAFAWLLGQPGVDKDRIGAAGASCGVNQAVLLASRHPEVKSVVLLSGGVTPSARTYLQNSDWLPVLAAGSDNDGDAVNNMRWVLGWSRNPKNKFVQFKNAGHGTDMFAVEKTLEPQIVDWYESTLRTAPAKPTASTAGAGKPSPVAEFWRTLAEPGGAAKAQTIYQTTKAAGRGDVLFPEGEMNAFGYQLLQQGGRTKDAIIVFQMNVDAYPQSANVYDSLSDAFLADGNTTEALKYAEKCLQVLATDTRIPSEFKQAIKESAEKKVRDLKK
jgi:dienelactone hydrolase